MNPLDGPKIPKQQSLPIGSDSIKGNTFKQRPKVPVSEAPVRSMRDRTVLKKQSSTVEFPGLKDDKGDVKECAARNGIIWDCVSRKRDEYGGYIYTFRVKDEFDNVTDNPEKKSRNDAVMKKFQDMFPAVELPADFIVNYFPQKDSVLDKQKPEEMMKWHLQFLGYSWDKSEKGIFVSMPDKEALESRWTILREDNPNLPRLNIRSSEGIASDYDFIVAYFSNDAILSSGVEFFHDQMSHIVMTLATILTSDSTLDYTKVKLQLVKKFMETYGAITMIKDQMNKFNLAVEERKKLEMQFTIAGTLVAALVDGITGIPDLEEIAVISRNNIQKMVFELLEDSRWKDFLERKYGQEEINLEKLNELSKNLEKVVREIQSIIKK